MSGNVPRIPLDPNLPNRACIRTGQSSLPHSRTSRNPMESPHVKGPASFIDSESGATIYSTSGIGRGLTVTDSDFLSNSRTTTICSVMHDSSIGFIPHGTQDEWTPNKHVDSTKQTPPPREKSISVDRELDFAKKDNHTGEVAHLSCIHETDLSVSSDIPHEGSPHVETSPQVHPSTVAADSHGEQKQQQAWRKPLGSAPRSEFASFMSEMCLRSDAVEDDKVQVCISVATSVGQQDIDVLDVGQLAHDVFNVAAEDVSTALAADDGSDNHAASMVFEAYEAQWKRFGPTQRRHTIRSSASSASSRSTVTSSSCDSRNSSREKKDQKNDTKGRKKRGPFNVLDSSFSCSPSTSCSQVFSINHTPAPYGEVMLSAPSTRTTVLGGASVKEQSAFHSPTLIRRTGTGVAGTLPGKGSAGVDIDPPVLCNTNKKAAVSVLTIDTQLCKDVADQPGSPLMEWCATDAVEDDEDQLSRAVNDDSVLSYLAKMDRKEGRVSRTTGASSPLTVQQCSEVAMNLRKRREDRKRTQLRVDPTFPTMEATEAFNEAIYQAVLEAAQMSYENDTFLAGTHEPDCPVFTSFAKPQLKRCETLTSRLSEGDIHETQTKTSTSDCNIGDNLHHNGSEATHSRSCSMHTTSVRSMHSSSSHQRSAFDKPHDPTQMRDCAIPTTPTSRMSHVTSEYSQPFPRYSSPSRGSLSNAPFHADDGSSGSFSPLRPHPHDSVIPPRSSASRCLSAEDVAYMRPCERKSQDSGMQTPSMLRCRSHLSLSDRVLQTISPVSRPFLQSNMQTQRTVTPQALPPGSPARKCTCRMSNPCSASSGMNAGLSLQSGGVKGVNTNLQQNRFVAFEELSAPNELEELANAAATAAKTTHTDPAKVANVTTSRRPLILDEPSELDT